jgi:hypothetical protein
MKKFIPRIEIYNADGENLRTGGVVDLNFFNVGDALPIFNEVVIEKNANGMKACEDKEEENCIQCDENCPFNSNPNRKEC